MSKKSQKRKQQQAAREKVFNLFVYLEDGWVREVGAVSHWCSGNDHQKLALLQLKVQQDFRVAKRYPVPARFKIVIGLEVVQGAIPYGAFEGLAHAAQMSFFEAAFQELGASAQPFWCMTMIANGQPRIDGVEHVFI